MVQWDWEVKEKVKQEVQRKKIDLERTRFKKRLQQEQTTGKK
ncbi:MAG: hypothetical protein ACXAEI_07415 [Candidatus Hodarchaeales archaeon]